MYLKHCMHCLIIMTVTVTIHPWSFPRATGSVYTEHGNCMVITNVLDLSLRGFLHCSSLDTFFISPSVWITSAQIGIRC